MSAEMMVAQVTNLPRQVQMFVRQLKAYFMRNKPVDSMMTLLVNNIKNFLSANKKLKIAKYRVAHLNYRLTQMERLMLENNPNNFKGGRNVDTYR